MGDKNKKKIATHHRQVEGSITRREERRHSRMMEFESRRHEVQELIFKWVLCRAVIAIAWLASVWSLSINAIRVVFK